MKNFNDKVVLITGGASGLGLGIAKHCAQLNMKLILVDIESASLAQAKQTLTEQGATVETFLADVSSESKIQALTTFVYRQFPEVNLLINNAGVSGPVGTIWEIPKQQLDWTLKVNVDGVIHCLRAFVPKMLAQKNEAHIVNVSSHFGLICAPHLAAYQLSKHAVFSITETLAEDLKVFRSQIGVSVFAPYFVKSELTNSERHLNNKENALFVAEQAIGTIERYKRVMQNSIDAEAAAKILFAGIEKNQRYIFTDGKTQQDFQKRVEKILAVN